uniref:NAD(P)/FAD-dependent oxidoreductase n=1 Tax=Chamaesiphon sp. OTE_8_metabat_110 TaxID=2964696 RepID=UPI00286C70A5
FPSTTMSRGLLEHLIRDRVFAIPNLKLLDRTIVKSLQTNPDRDRVIGIIVEQHGSAPPRSLTADLVVDVTGRSSRSGQWLKDLGYEPPFASKVHVNLCYTTRIYRRDPEDPRSHTWILNSPAPPQQSTFGGIIPTEGNRWIVSVGGWHGNWAPTTETGFLEFVRGLPSPDIYDIISQSEPLSAIVPYKFPFSLRRYYERLKRFPSGYLVLGDAVSSFNPTYGQGMSVAALEVVELDRVLTENVSPTHLAQTFFQRIAKIIDIPWQLAVGEDFRFPQTTGIKPLGTDLLNLYATWVHRTTLHDPVVGETFLQVMNLMIQPICLFYPRIVWRVLRTMLGACNKSTS